MQIFSLHVFFSLTCSQRQINAVRITLSTVGSLQALGLNGGHWGWPLSKLNCSTPLRVKKIDSKGPFLSKSGNYRFWLKTWKEFHVRNGIK